MNNVLIVNVDLPLPDTPVMQVSVPRGISQFTFFRLLPSAFIISIYLLLKAFLLIFGISIFNLPERYCPVILFGLLLICGPLPAATTYPPFTPAAGPKSTTWSAVVIASSSCSTTITVFPKSLNLLRVLRSLSLSR